MRVDADHGFGSGAYNAWHGFVAGAYSFYSTQTRDDDVDDYAAPLAGAPVP